MSDTYSENLSYNGRLIVTRKEWHIDYYFPGPDRRYNGTFYSIKGNKIDVYIRAWENNFKRFEELKKLIGENAEFSTRGETGMTINIGGYHHGVCLVSYHLCICSTDQLEKLIAEYRTAKTKANDVRDSLKTSGLFKSRIFS